MTDNTLHVGDNLGILARHIKDTSVGLIYLDPQLCTHAGCKALLSEGAGLVPSQTYREAECHRCERSAP